MSEYLTTVFFTVWPDKNGTTQQDFLYLMRSIGAKKIAIGGIEYTESNERHYHAICTLSHSMRFKTLKINLDDDTIHFEPLRDVSNAWSYIQKESLFYNDYDLAKFNASDVFTALINDIVGGLKFCDILKKYPKLCIYHFENIKKIYIEFGKEL